MVEASSQDNITTITLRPNRSATWAETRLFIAFLCASTLAVGVLWTVAGAWVVLPFSGLEALLIVLVFHRVSLNTYQRQVITLDGEDIHVQSGVHYPKHSWRFKRIDTSVWVRHPQKPLDNVDLKLVSKQQQLPLGVFLNREDRYRTLDLFREAGLCIRRKPV